MTQDIADWDNPLVDAESVALGYEKIKATDLKYQERIESLKLKSKSAWVWWVIGTALALVILMPGILMLGILMFGILMLRILMPGILMLIILMLIILMLGILML